MYRSVENILQGVSPIMQGASVAGPAGQASSPKCFALSVLNAFLSVAQFKQHWILD